MSMFLTEKLHTVLEYTEKATNPNCLGHLAGIGAEFNKPTRNGRRYPIELWKNVLKSEDFKEGMDTLTLFGECDHPTDRVDTSIKEVSVVLTNMELRENEGILWTEFDILDTPQGRILKSLIDYGCKIGVSSRGLGDEIQKDGETIIDPETYSFYGFDMVVQPAVKAARPTQTESNARGRAKVTDVFRREIENATTKDELVGLKRLAESVNVPDLDSIKESIENKLSNGSNDGNNISESLESDLGKLAEENESLKTQVENLKKANNIGAKRSKQLTETFETEARTARRTLRKFEVKTERLERVNSSLSEKLEEKDVLLSEYKKTINLEQRRTDRVIDDLQKQLDEANEEISMLRKQLREKSKELGLKDNQLESLTESYRDSESRIIELENVVSNKTSELGSLYEENDALSSDLENVNSKHYMTETKVQDVSNELEESKNKYSEILEKYLDTKCESVGVEKERALNMLDGDITMQNIDMVVEKLSDEKRRLNKMPLALNGNSITAKLESYSTMNPEDVQTMKFLTGFK